MKIICKGFSIRCTVIRRIKWNQPAILTIKASLGGLQLTRANFRGTPFHRQLHMNDLLVKQQGPTLTFSNRNRKYLLDCESVLKARVMIKLIRVFQQFHQSIQQSKQMDCPICMHETNPIITLMPCRHKICHQCYLSWPQTCPFCRQPIQIIKSNSK